MFQFIKEPNPFEFLNKARIKTDPLFKNVEKVLSDIETVILTIPKLIECKDVKTAYDSYSSKFFANYIQLGILLEFNNFMMENPTYTDSDTGKEVKRYRKGYREIIIQGYGEKHKIKYPRCTGDAFRSDIVSEYRVIKYTYLYEIMFLIYSGMTYSEAIKFLEGKGIHVSKGFLTTFTNKNTQPLIDELSSKKLESHYPIISVDALYYPVKEKGGNATAVYIGYGVTQEGKKEILGMDVYTDLASTENNEGWNRVLESYKKRGLETVDYISSDARKGLAETIKKHFPKATYITCIVHVEHTIERVLGGSYTKEQRQLVKSFKEQPSIKKAKKVLKKIQYHKDESFADEAYKALHNQWNNLKPMFLIPIDVRRIVYSTNRIESLNSVLRIKTSKRHCYQTVRSLLKFVIGCISTLDRIFDRKVNNWESYKAFSNLKNKDSLDQAVA